MGRYNAKIKLELKFNSENKEDAENKIKSFVTKLILLEEFKEYSFSWNGNQKLTELPF